MTFRSRRKAWPKVRVRHTLVYHCFHAPLKSLFPYCKACLKNVTPTLTALEPLLIIQPLPDHFGDNHDITTTIITIPRPVKQYCTTFSLPNLFTQWPWTHFLQRFPALSWHAVSSFRPVNSISS